MKALGVQRLLVLVLCNIVVATPHLTGQPHTHSHHSPQQAQLHRQQTLQQQNNQHLTRQHQQQQHRQQNNGQQGVVVGNQQQHEQDHQQTQQPQHNPTVTQQPQHQQQQQTHQQQNNQQPQQPSPQQQQQQPLNHQQQPQQQQQQPLNHHQQQQPQHQDHISQVAGNVKFPNDEALPPNATANEVHEGRESQCNELPDPGECRGAFPRYYFNTKNDQCDCFLYGGCDDDPNITEPGRSSWFTLDACVQSCKPSKKEKGPSCKQLSSPGSSSGNSTSKPVGVADTSHLSDEDFLNILQP